MKPSAPARLALDADAAGHQLAELLDQRETEPGSTILPGAAGVGLLKALEDALVIGRRDADARVGHRQLEHLSLRAQEHLDATATRRELQGVPEQVHHDLLEHAPIDRERVFP